MVNCCNSPRVASTWQLDQMTVVNQDETREDPAESTETETKETASSGGIHLAAPTAAMPTGEMTPSCTRAPFLRIAPPIDTDSKKGTVALILELLKGMKIGGDVASVAVPPTFNIPKSQLQMFAESAVVTSTDLLGACTAGATPLERFLAVVRWHLSTVRPTVFGKAPYNPTLGETHHISVGDTNVMLEQVSHHPPITALWAVNEKRRITMTWWHQPVPRFYGSWMEAEIKGRRLLHLGEHAESYEASSPRLSFRFLPSPGAEWVGTTFVKCEETGYEAKVEFKSKPFFGMRGASSRIAGKIWNADKEELYELSGRWDRIVYVKDLSTREERVLYDYAETIAGLEAPRLEDPKSLLGTETVLVWSQLTNALLEENLDDARREKSKVESEQRALRKRRKEAGEVWEPRLFELDESGHWMWKDPKRGVPPSPIVAKEPRPLQ